MARFKFPDVKSWCEPLSASRTEDQNPRSPASAGGGSNHSRTDIRISPRYVPRPKLFGRDKARSCFRCSSSDETRGRDHAKGSRCEQCVICRITPGLSLTSGSKEWENPRQCSARISYGGRLKHCFLQSRKGPAGLKTITRFRFQFPAKSERIPQTFLQKSERRASRRLSRPSRYLPSRYEYGCFSRRNLLSLPRPQSHAQISRSPTHSPCRCRAFHDSLPLPAPRLH